MFEQFFDSFRKTTEATLQMQQEMFKKMTGLCPAIPAGATPAEPTKFQKKWVEVVGDLIKKQRETLEAQFCTGLRNAEEAFHLIEVKDPEELRTRTTQLMQKTIDCIRQACEAPVRDFQAAVAKWNQVFTNGAA